MLAGYALMCSLGTWDCFNGKGRDSRERNSGCWHVLQAEGAEAQDSEGSTSPSQGQAIVQRAPVWDLPAHRACGVTCSLTKLCQGHCRCVGSCYLPVTAHLWDGRKREEEHAWDWSLLYRCEELQNPWHTISTEVTEGDSRSVQGTQRQEKRKGACASIPADTMHISLTHWQHCF